MPCAKRAAHPRAGGENPRAGAGACPAQGSSPRGRGKHLRPVYRRRREGLIPARAGKTAPKSPPSRPAPAHPRAGGENKVKGVAAKPVNGSSPRGRGKRLPRLHQDRLIRLIPARAGKTSPPKNGDSLLWAHPRAGGENGWEDVADLSAMGSSPRGRGKRQIRDQRRDDRGLIPARAGKT